MKQQFKSRVILILLNIMFYAPMGILQIELIDFYCLFFPVFPFSSGVFISLWHFDVNTKLSTSLVGCWSSFCLTSQEREETSTPNKTCLKYRVNVERPTGKKNNYLMGRRWKIENNNNLTLTRVILFNNCNNRSICRQPIVSNLVNDK